MLSLRILIPSLHYCPDSILLIWIATSFFRSLSVCSFSLSFPPSILPLCPPLEAFTVFFSWILKFHRLFSHFLSLNIRHPLILEVQVPSIIGHFHIFVVSNFLFIIFPMPFLVFLLVRFLPDWYSSFVIFSLPALHSFLLFLFLGDWISFIFKILFNLFIFLISNYNFKFVLFHFITTDMYLYILNFLLGFSFTFLVLFSFLGFFSVSNVISVSWELSFPHVCFRVWLLLEAFL